MSDSAAWERLSDAELAWLIHDAELTAAREDEGYRLSQGEWENVVLRATYELRELRS